MRYVRRSIEKELFGASRSFPAILLTGPRRAGKTTLLKKLFPKASYYLLEDPDIISRINIRLVDKLTILRIHALRINVKLAIRLYKSCAPGVRRGAH